MSVSISGVSMETMRLYRVFLFVTLELVPLTVFLNNSINSVGDCRGNHKSLDVVSEGPMTNTSFMRSDLQSNGVELLGVLIGVRADE